MRNTIGDELIREFLADALRAMSDKDLDGLYGPTEMKVGRHPELFYGASLGVRTVSIAFTPKKGSWWVSLRRAASRSFVTCERVYSSKHDMAPKLESFVNLIRGQLERNEVAPEEKRDGRVESEMRGTELEQVEGPVLGSDQEPEQVTEAS